MASLVHVLRHRDFKFLWLANSASILGDGIVTVALALFVTDLTGDASDLGLVLASSALPLVAFMLIGGVWGDRLSRQRLMISTDLIRFVLHGALALLIIFGEPQIWQIIVIELLFGTAEAFFRPAATALVPQTVPEAEIQEANALIATVNNVAEFAGPALATALVLGLGAGAAFAVDALTFLVSAVLLTQVRVQETFHVPEGEKRDSTWTAIREGFEEVRSRAWIWVSLIGFSVALFTGLAPWLVLGPTIAEQEYGEIGTYGLVAAALGIGTVAGSLVGIRWRPLHPMRLATAFAVIWPLAAVPFGAGVTLVLVVPATVLAGFAVGIFDVWWMTALSERIPADKLSRVSSYDWMIAVGLLPLGFILAGPIADSIGAVEVLIGGSVLASAVLALTLLSREIWTLERIHGGPGGPPPAEHPPLPPA